MTWHSFFNFSTMQHRHLVFSYITVIVVQGGYFAWIARSWQRTKSTRN
jgi:hypothetical protein